MLGVTLVVMLGVMLVVMLVSTLVAKTVTSNNVVSTQLNTTPLSSDELKAIDETNNYLNVVICSKSKPRFKLSDYGYSTKTNKKTGLIELFEYGNLIKRFYTRYRAVKYIRQMHGY